MSPNLCGKKLMAWGLVGVLSLDLMISAAQAEEKAATESTAPSIKSEKDGPKKVTTQDESSGDTYNFYFQKGPAPQKVEQGGSQKVEQASSPVVETSDPVEVKSSSESALAHQRKEKSIDLFLGPGGISGKDASGLSLGADFFPSRPISVRFELFEMSGAGANTGRDSSDFFRMGSHDANELTGANLGLQYNVFRDNKIRFAPIVGIAYINDRQKNYPDFSFDEESTGGESTHIVIAPYVGVAGAFYFSNNFGANASFIVPSDTHYAKFGIGFVWSI